MEASTETSNNMALNDDTCPLCISGHEPEGQFLCLVCIRPVHAIEPCSYFYSEERLKQNRICFICHKSKNMDIALHIREKENWRGKGNHDVPNGFYLGQNKEKLSSALAWKTRTDVPILKNASSPDLHPVTLNQKSVTLTNTCAFDSVFQTILAASFDNPVLKEKVFINVYQLIFVHI